MKWCMCVFGITESFNKRKKSKLFTNAYGHPVKGNASWTWEFKKIYCFLLFWGVGGARKKPSCMLMRVAARVTHRVIKVPYLWVTGTASGHRTQVTGPKFRIVCTDVHMLCGAQTTFHFTLHHGLVAGGFLGNDHTLLCRKFKAILR